MMNDHLEFFLARAKRSLYCLSEIMLSLRPSLRKEMILPLSVGVVASTFIWSFLSMTIQKGVMNSKGQPSIWKDIILLLLLDYNLMCLPCPTWKGYYMPTCTCPICSTSVNPMTSITPSLQDSLTNSFLPVFQSSFTPPPQLSILSRIRFSYSSMLTYLPSMVILKCQESRFLLWFLRRSSVPIWVYMSLLLNWEKNRLGYFSLRSWKSLQIFASSPIPMQLYIVNYLCSYPFTVIFHRSSSSCFPKIKYSCSSSAAFISQIDPPQPSERDRSLPVPKGMMAAGGLCSFH